MIWLYVVLIFTIAVMVLRFVDFDLLGKIRKSYPLPTSQADQLLEVHNIVASVPNVTRIIAKSELKLDSNQGLYVKVYSTEKELILNIYLKKCDYNLKKRADLTPGAISRWRIESVDGKLKLILKNLEETESLIQAVSLHAVE